MVLAGRNRARVGISAATVVRASHVGPRTDSLIRPTFPLAKGIEADGNHRRLVGRILGVGVDRSGGFRSPRGIVLC